MYSSLYWSPLAFGLIMSIVLGVSSSNMFMLWFMMEMNMLLFIGLMTQSNYFDSGQSIQYFIIQVMASIIFLMSWMMVETKLIMMSVMYFSMLIKLGAAPFHFWFFLVVKSVSWDIFFLISSVQKILPLLIIFMFNIKYYVFSILTAMVSSFGGLMANSMKELLAYSSLLSLSWMISSSLFFLVLVFMFFYMMGLLCLILSNSKLSDFWVSSGFSSQMSKMNFWSGVLSMAGVPPTLGFWGKLLIIFSLLSSNLIMVAFLLLFAGVSLYLYLRLLLSMFFFQKSHMVIFSSKNFFPLSLVILMPLGLFF